MWLSYGGSDHLLVIEDDIIEKHLVLLTTPLSPSLAMFMINYLPSTRPAIEVLPRSRILDQVHFPRTALKTKMIRFEVRDVLY